jgi:protein-L-isoaspartate O-methyltransferase
MLAVPRGSFVPPEYQAEAWVDSPIRVSHGGKCITLTPHLDQLHQVQTLHAQPESHIAALVVTLTQFLSVKVVQHLCVGFLCNQAAGILARLSAG